MGKRMFRRDSALTILKEAESRLSGALNWIAAGEEGEDPRCSFAAVNRQYNRTLKKLRGFIAAAELLRSDVNKS